MSAALLLAAVVIVWNAAMIVHGATTGRLFLPWSRSIYTNETALFWFCMVGAAGGVCLGLLILAVILGV